MKKWLAILCCGLFLLTFGGCGMDEKQKQGKRQAERYFAQANNPRVLNVARRIGTGEALDNRQLEAIRQDIDQRHYQSITLLFFALKQRNLHAIDKLLEHGASPYVPDKPEGSIRDFINYIVSAGHDLDFTLEALKLYLKHGGDSNYALANYSTPIVSITVSMDNFAQFEALVEAGADVWAIKGKNTKNPKSSMDLAAMRHRYHFIEYALEKNLFNSVDEKALSRLMDYLSFYKQRGDDISLQIQAITRKIMQETDYPGDQYTQKIFADKQINGR